MENASDALIMAFSVLVLIIALTVAINSYNSVKSISDIVLYNTDKTNYYEYQGATGKAAENRIVGLETIIPTLYKYYKENYTVLFRDGTGYNEETGDFTRIDPLVIYNTPSNYKAPNGIQLWGKNYDDLLKNKYQSYFTDGYNKDGSKDIFSFDLDEETLRHEPWTGSYIKAKENLDCMLDGEKYNNPNNGTEYINYGSGFISKYENYKFVETIGEYIYSSSQTEDSEISQLLNSINRGKKNKKIIIFTRIKN